jgi:hypothetical protein
MARKRIEIMEKARAKRSRREAARRKKNVPAGGAGLPEKVIDLTQEALDKIEDLVKTTSKKIKDAVGRPLSSA